MIVRARKFGIIDASSVAIDASKLTAYEHSVPKSRIPQNNPTLSKLGWKAGHQW